ncbi:MAG: helicase HerA domain-containing protein [Nitrososphaerales archaeon]
MSKRDLLAEEVADQKQERGKIFGGRWLENLDGKLVAKLREVLTQSRLSADGKTTTTFKLAKVEASYDPGLVQKLAPGQLLAIPNVKNLESQMTFSVFEIADISPMHYSMLTLNTSQPGALRGEFMGLIEKEWKHSSKSTWVDILASPTGYIVDFSEGIPKYERKYSPLLVGSEVKLLNKEAVRQFVCYVPPTPSKAETYRIGDLLGVIDEKVPFTIDFTQLINYHIGVFCHTGGGKSYLTSMILRKALAADDDLKVVIVDVSSEYGIHLLDQLVTLPSRVILPYEPTDDDGGRKQQKDLKTRASEYRKKHVLPDALELKQRTLELLIENLFREEKCKSLYLKPGYLANIEKFRTYEGFLESASMTAQEKYNSNQQAAVYVIDQIEHFLQRTKKKPSSQIDGEVLPVIKEILDYFQASGVRQNSTIYGLVTALKGRIEQDIGEPEEIGYSLDTIVGEVLSHSKDSPRLFVINEEIEKAREIARRLLDKVFAERRDSFNLHPRILFVFDEAQEFVPNDTAMRGVEGVAECSRAVERLLRHGRKYHLHGWISTQRLAHLNTSALHQIHSYFVGTLPRPYDRQLVGDTFAIDDALLERSLNFAPGDWMLASFRATKTQNVPVFFHAINNEDYVLPKE